jgi:DNA-binding CsgD family transcriptional regulator
MLGDHGGHRSVVDGSTPGFPLGFAVADPYADLRITPVLRRLLTHSRELLQTVAGSVSLVDPALGSYAKVAESGVACQLGQTFPLHEGATGQAFAHRRPVVIDDYSDLPAGHLPKGHPAGRGAAAAVPLWWRGEVIGVNVAFAGRRRRFTAAEIDAFEVLTQSVGIAVVEARAAVPSLAGLLHEHGRIRAGATGVQTVVREVGPARPVCTPSPLTRREAEVLRLLADGLSDREVAARLMISRKTVEKHVGAVLRKTDTVSRTAAVVRALDRGWVGEQER